MPTPVAKGLIFGVAALVAAGIAVYESPQFRRWVEASRRRLALTLHNLGNEIDPGEAEALRHDISMMEEVGAAADERRRIAREEIQRRRGVFEERRKRSSSSIGTFDSLVDEHGHLLGGGQGGEKGVGSPVAKSTGVDLGVAQPVHRGQQSEKQPESTVLYDAEPETKFEPAPDESKLRLSIPAPRSRASSDSNTDFTPVSETPHDVIASMVSPSIDGHVRSPSSHTEGGSLSPDIVYAHPSSIASGNIEDARSSFSDLEGLRFTQSRPVTPQTPSTADKFSHIAVDASSDGVLSEFEGSVGRVATPASWSEIGSDVSGDDYHNRGF